MPKIRANGEGSIRQRKDGRWEVRITVGTDFTTGEPRRLSRYAATQEEAVHLLHQLQVAYSQGNDISGSVTVQEWLETWLTIYMKNNLKQSTRASYESYIKNHFVPAFGRMALRDLTPRLLQQFYNYKTEQEGLSPKTILNINLCLHKALEHAAREGLIPSNPASAINLPRGNRPTIEILTLDEQARVVRASYQHRYGLFVRLALFTGLRLGELLGLQWTDIDFNARILYVRRTLNRLQKTGLPKGYIGPRTEIVIQEPKTQNSIRTIPLLPMLLQELSHWRSVQDADRMAAGEQYQNSKMLVTNPLGGYIEPRTFKDYYNEILSLAGVGHRTFHALRHTFASRALEQGMDAKTLSVLLGHYSVAFTLDTYAHVLDNHKREGMQLMEELYQIGVAPQSTSYPVIATHESSGEWSLTVPDFPMITCISNTLDSGLQIIKGQLHEEMQTMAILPPASNPTSFILLPGQIALQIAV